MPSFLEQQQRYANKNTIGQQLKIMSDEVMQATFDNDIATRQCYIYDYYHDDQKDLLPGTIEYDPSKSKTKIPVKLKFIIKEYKSASKDEPEYHIQFQPEDWNNHTIEPNWFYETYGKYGVQFPVGQTVDIPDDRGIYWKYLIFYNETANQFPKFGVFKCNYLFQWVSRDGANRYIRKMWGVKRSQSSYTSGEWTGRLATTLDNQDKFFISWNQVSAEFEHDMRLFISILQPKPFVYKVSKVQNASPFGVVTVTVVQSEYNKNTDYVNLETGEMLADYYDSDLLPSDGTFLDNTDSDNSDGEIHENDTTSSLVLNTASYEVSEGYEHHISAKIVDKNNEEESHIYLNDDDEVETGIYVWSMKLGDIVIDSDNTDSIDDTIVNKFEVDTSDLVLEIVENEKYIGQKFTITCTYMDSNGINGVSRVLHSSHDFVITY